MTIKQRITKGLGALTPSAWADIVAVVDPTGSYDPDVAKNGKGTDRQSFLAVITGATQDGANLKWAYAWSQVRRTNGANTFATVSGGLTSSSNGGKPALNILEAGNTSSLAYGFTVSPTSGNLTITGFSFQRVPNNAVVEMCIRRDSAGATSYEFSAPNRIDGACPSSLVGDPIDGGDYGAS
jgi:hypothetical protein